MKAQGAKQFVVVYDPEKVDPARLLETVRGLRYRPSLAGSVHGRREADGVTIESWTELEAVQAGGEARLQVTVTPGKGKQVEGATVEVKGGPLGEQSSRGEAEVRDGKGTATITLPIPRGAAGQHRLRVTVRIKLDGQERPIELTVPVTVR